MDPISLALEHRAWERKRWFLMGWCRKWESDEWGKDWKTEKVIAKRVVKAFYRERATACRMLDRPEKLNLSREVRNLIRYFGRALR